MSHEEFISRYRLLIGKDRCEGIEPLEMCQRIIESYQMDAEIRVGKTLVYATEYGIELAEQWKERTRHTRATTIQRWWKQKIERKRAAQTIQNWWRARRRNLATSKVQRWWRKKLANKKLLMNLSRILAASKVQTWWRKKLANKRLLVNLSHFVKSARLVKRAVHRWVQAKKLAKRIKKNQNDNVKQVENNNVEQVENNNVKPVSLVKTSVIKNSASQPTIEKIHEKLNEFQNFKTSELSFSLPRTTLFYKDGVVSIRRPFPVSYFQLSTISCN